MDLNDATEVYGKDVVLELLDMCEFFLNKSRTNYDIRWLKWAQKNGIVPRSTKILVATRIHRNDWANGETLYNIIRMRDGNRAIRLELKYKPEELKQFYQEGAMT